MTQFRNFTDADVRKDGELERLAADPNDLEYAPPDWMARGRQETSSGYGRRLNSGYKIRFNGRAYRLYVTIFSNNGTTWFKAGGRTIIVH